MKIKIPFNKWSRDRIQQGIKTATTRNKKYGEIGDRFMVDGSEFVLTVVSRVTLGTVAEISYDVEGAKSKAEFIRIWNKIHPRKRYVPYQKVWYHRFTQKE